MMASTTDDEIDVQDGEKAFLPDEARVAEVTGSSKVSYRFWVSASINTGATAAIVRSRTHTARFELILLLGLRQQTHF